MHLSVGFKIGLTSCLAVVAMLALGTVAHHNVSAVNEDTKQVSHSYQIIDAVNDLLNGVSAAEVAERGYLLEGKRDYLDSYYAAVGNAGQKGAIMEAWDRANALTGADGKEQERLNSLQPLLQRQLTEMKDLIDVRSRLGLPAAQSRLATFPADSRTQLRQIISSISQGQEALLQAHQVDQENSVRSTLVTILLGVPLFAVLMGIAALLLSRDIVAPLKDMSVVAGRAATGDLNQRVQGEARADEVGILARAFNSLMDSMAGTSRLAEQISQGNLRVEVHAQSEHDLLGQSLSRMVDNLQAMLQDLNHAAGVIGSSASQMAASSVQMAASSSETSAAVVETSATVGEVRQTAQVASQEARQVAERARQAAQAARDGRDATEAAGDGMLRIRDQMTLISSSMMRLSEQSQAISEIISTVDDLTQQSNLLAVNAAIEAAKAGERGKGFAVVAQEVRSLAEQSKQATTQVRAILSDVQKATSAAVLATEQGTKSVESGLLQFAQAGGAIRVLDESVADAAQSASQIASSSQEQLVGMEQLAQAMDNIKQASHQNVESARQLEDSAKDLSNLGQSLQQQVGRYKV